MKKSHISTFGLQKIWGSVDCYVRINYKRTHNKYVKIDDSSKEEDTRGSGSGGNDLKEYKMGKKYDDEAMKLGLTYKGLMQCTKK